jgi:F-type H+-transporting ATPase subunit beta
VTELFTGIPGEYVIREDTIRSFKGLVEERYNDLLDKTFSIVGSIDQAVEKVKGA